MIDNGIFNLCGIICSLEKLKDKTFQEVLLLAKILLILQLCYLEGIHRDGLFLAVGNVGSLKIVADSLIAVARIHDDHICILLIILSHHGIHEKALAASTWSQYKEIGIVGIFHLTFLSSNVNGKRQPLPVSIVTLQRRIVTLLLMLLIHQAKSRLRKREESVIVLIEFETVARETGYKEFQLVIGSLRYMDTVPREHILQGISNLLEVFITSYLDHHIIMGINKHLAVSGDFRLNLFYVLNGNLVVGIGNGSMTVLFLVKLHDFLLLIWQKDNLIINQGIYIRERIQS